MTALAPLRQGPSVWKGPEMNQRKEEWIWYLNPSEVKELEKAAESYLKNGLEIGQMKDGQFPLPSLGKRLAQLKHQLIKGIGFGILRGLPVTDYTEQEMSAIFFGIGTHLGSARSQNAMGHVLGHVRNMGLDSRDPKVRLYQTNERQTFHTDSSDVVGLLCVQPAKEGGLSLLVSANTVYNEMYHQRPDLLQLLMQEIAMDRRGEIPDGMLPYFLIPVFSYFKGYITPFYQRQYFESSQRFPEAPRLSAKHLEAMDLFDDLCNDPTLHLTMMLEKGDMQFVYNHAMLHDRTGFIDWHDLDKRRHLMRLWLAVPGDRPLPAVFASRYGSIEVGNRGGIIVPGSQLNVPMISDIIKNQS